MMKEEYDNRHQNERQNQIGIDTRKFKEPKQFDARDTGDAIRATGDIRPIIQDSIYNELEAHRRNHEIVTLQPDRGIRHQETESPRKENHQSSNYHQRQIKLHKEIRSDISTNAIESSLTHGKEVGHTDGQVCAQGQHDVDVEHDDDMKHVLHILHDALFISRDTLRSQEQEN